MKKISVLFVFVSLLFTIGCKKQLDLQPHKIYYDNFYTTAEDANSAINAVYDVPGSVGLYNSNIWLFQDIGSDDCYARANLNDPNIHAFDNYTITPDNIYLAGTWQASYLGISRANIVLDKVPTIQMDSTLKSQIIGQASFLRALFYFNLVRMFGDVPLVLDAVSANLSNEEIDVERSSVSLVYTQIEQDLEAASKLLPTNYYKPSDKGRATKGAVLALLSKVYLTTGDWENASKYAKAVIDLGVYGLFDHYEDNFKEINKNGMESVFEVQFTSSVVSENSRMVISGLPSIPGLFSAGVEIMLPTEDLLNSFEEGDHRKEVTFFDHYWYYNFSPHIWKYWDQDAYTPDETAQSGADFFVMRYSEVLLIEAEASNELHGPTDEAYQAVNAVRARARNGNPDVLPDLQGLSKDALREAIYKEKRCETVDEGQRWFDLVRTGKLIENVKRAKGNKSNPQAFNYLFPIPQREMDINSKLTQNPGY